MTTATLMTLELPEGALAFRDAFGRMMVVTGPGSQDVFFRSGRNGEPFQQLLRVDGDFRHDLTDFYGTLTGPGLEHSRHGIGYAGGDLAVDGVLFFPSVQPPRQIEYLPLPTSQQVSHFYQLDDGRIFYVVQSLFEDDFVVACRAFIGAGDNMRRIREMREFNRQRRVETSAGTLWFPSGKPVNWTNRDGACVGVRRRLDPADFDIVETDQGVTITAKPVASA